MKKILVPLGLAVCCLLVWTPSAAQETCLKVTLTGTLGGPVQFDILPGAGTLVQFGTVENECSDGAQLQFDAGRATVNSLGGLGVSTTDIDAIFLTHIHNDHTEGLFAFFHDLWIRSSVAVVDVVCHRRVFSPEGHFIDCRKLVAGIGRGRVFSGIDGPTQDAGEIAQRQFELNRSDTPSDRANMHVFRATNAPELVWSKKAVSVTAIRSTHIPGHVSYRMDTPAGSVVVGGDAANDDLDPATRPFSTSEQVEALAIGAEIIVHSAIHPGLGPGSGFPEFIFARQSTAIDLGAMANRAGAQHLMLTHLIPALGQPDISGVPIPIITPEDWRNLAAFGGFTGTVHVGPPSISVMISDSP